MFIFGKKKKFMGCKLELKWNLVEILKVNCTFSWAHVSLTCAETQK